VLAKQESTGSGKDEDNNHARGTRLRQVVCHPFNLERFLRRELRSDDINTLKQRLKEEGEKTPILDQVVKGLKHTSFSTTYSKGLARLATELGGKQAVLGGIFDMQELLQLILNEHELEGAKCGICGTEIIKAGGKRIDIDEAEEAERTRTEMIKAVESRTNVIEVVGSRNVGPFINIMLEMTANSSSATTCSVGRASVLRPRKTEYGVISLYYLGLVLTLLPRIAPRRTVGRSLSFLVTSKPSNSSSTKHRKTNR
jgi:hypothetical protein